MGKITKFHKRAETSIQVEREPKVGPMHGADFDSTPQGGIMPQSGVDDASRRLLLNFADCFTREADGWSDDADAARRLAREIAPGEAYPQRELLESLGREMQAVFQLLDVDRKAIELNVHWMSWAGKLVTANLAIRRAEKWFVLAQALLSESCPKPWAVRECLSRARELLADTK